LIGIRFELCVFCVQIVKCCARSCIRNECEIEVIRVASDEKVPNLCPITIDQPLLVHPLSDVNRSYDIRKTDQVEIYYVSTLGAWRKSNLVMTHLILEKAASRCLNELNGNSICSGISNFITSTISLSRTHLELHSSLVGII
jgi:hypothetical protein